MEHHTDLFAKARELETEMNWPEAASAYEIIVKQDPLNEMAIQRLLILYRKLKESKKELRLLDESIKANQANYLNQQKNWGKKNKSAAKISGALAKRLSGEELYKEPIVLRWQKRKQGLLKKLKTD
ncbi:MAG TPA: hypothetical protein VKR32_10005 [Puia sp.]|nr:hypothetical protein [Puia sp.]